MGVRGPQPRKLFSTEWSARLAYAIGLLASDGCLSPPFSLIDLTSEDHEQLENFIDCLGVPLRITYKPGGGGRRYGRVQFKNVLFYKFLLSIGLTPKKSKRIGPLAVPGDFFWDFLRGLYDGDGSSHAYWDPRWKSSYMFYTIFVSASADFIDWLRAEIRSRTGFSGHTTCDKRGSVYQLKFAKKDSLVILRAMYHSANVVALSRKRLKVERILATIGERL